MLQIIMIDTIIIAQGKIERREGENVLEVIYSSSKQTNKQ